MLTLGKVERHASSGSASEGAAGQGSLRAGKPGAALLALLVQQQAPWQLRSFCHTREAVH